MFSLKEYLCDSSVRPLCSRRGDSLEIPFFNPRGSGKSVSEFCTRGDWSMIGETVYLESIIPLFSPLQISAKNLLFLVSVWFFASSSNLDSLCI